MTDLGTLGGLTSEALAINNVGQVVGDSTYNPGSLTPVHAFLWQNGAMTDLGTLSNDSCSRVNAISSLGAVAGIGICSGNGAFLWSGSGMSTVPPTNPDGSSAGESGAFGINAQNQIVGQTITSVANSSVYYWQAAVWNGLSGPSVIGPPNFGSTAAAINDAGQIVGFTSYDPNPSNQCLADFANYGVGLNNSNPSFCEAVLWQNGTMQDLGTLPGGGGAVALSINKKGDVVGISLVNNVFQLHAFLYQNGAMIDLNNQIPANSGWILQQAVGINDNGQIIVQAQPVNGGATHALLLTPVITPTTTALAVSISPSVFGQQISFVAIVSPTASSSVTPTGNVTFSDSSNVLGTAPLSSGTAVFNTSILGVGSHSISVSYAGDNNFSSSTSATLSEPVNQATSMTALAASPNPATFGQAVTFTATVTVVAPGAGTPTAPDVVTFLDGATTLGTATLNGAATATFSTSALASGSHSLTALYAGATNFTATTSSTAVTLTLHAPPPPVFQITDNETISVTDTASFPDVFDPEAIHVTDAVFVTPLIKVGAPVAEFSAGSLGFGGQSGSQTITVSDIGLASLTLTSTTISGSSQFAVTQISCTNSELPE